MFCCFLWLNVLFPHDGCCYMISMTGQSYASSFFVHFCHSSVTWCLVSLLIGEVVGAVWSRAVVSSASYSNCLKGKQIKEQMHNWIYITHLDEIFIFWFLMKNAVVLQRSVCVFVCVDTLTPVWLVHDTTLLSVPVNTVAWLQDTLQTVRSITLLCTAHCPSFSYTLVSCSRLTHRKLSSSHQHWFHLIEISLLMPSEEFYLALTLYLKI